MRISTTSMQKYLKWFTVQKHFFLSIENKQLDLKRIYITLWKWILECCEEVKGHVAEQAAVLC